MSPEFLVTFGRANHLGRFRAADNITAKRGDPVVIRSVRGLEVGTVLGHVRQSLPDPFVGDLIRAANDDDISLLNQRRLTEQTLCDDAEALARKAGIALVVLDAEISLDGRAAVLHALAGTAADAGQILDQLGTRHDIIVRLYDLSTEPTPPADAADSLEEFKCDKPDCGEGECTDCGTDGGCSSCSAGGAKELEAHFADLRDKMEERKRLSLA